MMRYRLLILSLTLSFLIHTFSVAQKKSLDSTLHTFRNGETREWSEFPVFVRDKHYVLRFNHQAGNAAQTLCLRQYDVKQTWRVKLNGHDVGTLVSDEKDMLTYFSIPSAVLRNGENVLTVRCDDRTPDDIKVGELVMDTRPLHEVLAEATLDVSIVDAATSVLMPGRITIINSKGTLQTVTSSAKKALAIRPGYAYTANGRAALELPAGTYTVFAGRGFEYGIDSLTITLNPGDHATKRFRLNREVNTTGWISSDTHIHTVTHSGHGDATSEERAITIAGEGIELPVLTDHNIAVDLKPVADAMTLLRYFKPVTGNELTTHVGHFNIFEATAGAPTPDHKAQTWAEISSTIQDKENDKVIILNHARDIHNDFRPFDPVRHLSSTGTSAPDWNLPANAMEVINSGSQQTDFMNLYLDWFGMLNKGHYLTPIGSSDSHDVSRYTVGQGRTYVQSAVDDPASIDVKKAIRNILEGRVMVSLGLMTKIMVNDAYGVGDLVPGAAQVNVAVEVHGPKWTRAERMTLYANGKKIREQQIANGGAAGIKWKGSWQIEVPRHDIFLVAIAEGPADNMPYWPIAKPYQPFSPNWSPKVIGSTGAIWIDGDKSGKRNSAHDYAAEILTASKGDFKKLIALLKTFDEAVAMQVATMLWKEGKSLVDPKLLGTLNQAAPATKAAFAKMIEETSALRIE